MAEKVDIWMPLYIRDYIADTTRLTTQQHGAYLLILMDYWMSGAPPDDDVVLARIARLDLAEWQSIRASIEPYFSIEGGMWRHGRLEHEHDKAAGQKRRSRSGGGARWGEPSGEERGRHLRSKRLAEARKKGTHTALEWEALKAFCGPQCVRCGAEAPLVKDHIQPIYQGGSDAIENLQPMCRKCNASKGSEDADHRPEGWDKAVEKAVRKATNALSDASKMPSQCLPDACTSPSPSPTSIGDPDGSPLEHRDDAQQQDDKIVQFSLAESEGDPAPAGEDLTFDRFWSIWRDGAGCALDRSKAEARWGRLSLPNRRLVFADLITRDRFNRDLEWLSWKRDDRGFRLRAATYLNQQKFLDEWIPVGDSHGQADARGRDPVTGRQLSSADRVRAQIARQRAAEQPGRA